MRKSLHSGPPTQVSDRRAKSSPSRLPSILLAEGLIASIYHYVQDFRHQHGAEVETGGILAGECVKLDERPAFRLSGFIDAGPRADCSPESVLFDSEYQARTLKALRVCHPSIGNMGCIHLHPRHLDVCSEGDWLADIEALRTSDTKTLVFAIITINNPRQDPLSLYYHNYKFDFFVLGRNTGFEYQHTRPTLEPLPVLATKPGLLNGSENLNPPGEGRRHYTTWPKVLTDKRRLVAEVRAMEERYGGRATLRLEAGRLFWEYTVIESGRSFPVRVCYPRRYPLEPPRIISLLPLPPSPHQMPGNELCWTNRSGPCDWNPARDTAATCILAAHRWFACLLVYLTLGKWPAEADEELNYFS